MLYCQQFRNGSIAWNHICDNQAYATLPSYQLIRKNMNNNIKYFIYARRSLQNRHFKTHIAQKYLYSREPVRRFGKQNPLAPNQLFYRN